MNNILDEMKKRLDEEIERTMFGGYPPGYDHRTGMPGTLKFGFQGCPHGCQVVCLHFTAS
jgi:hypothetical protein